MRSPKSTTRISVHKGLIVSLLLLTASALARAEAPWLGPAWRFRVPVAASAGAYERVDMPAEVQLNFTELMSAYGFNGPFIENSLRVVEVNSNAIIDTAVAFQFDKDSDYSATSKASGQLVLVMEGVTAGGATRSYHVYFHGGQESFQPAQVTPQVTLTDNIIDAGQSSFRIQAVGSTYFYHKQGAGFSSWVDASGNDWISYAVGGGSAGDYRGIPNAGYPGGIFHPGFTTSSSNIIHTGPVKATFRSATTDGKWECQWEVYPRFARMTMIKADRAYWFLYEGTPGGLLQPTTDFMIRSNGTQTNLSVIWNGDIATDEWVYFSDPNVGTGGRSLYMAHSEDDGAVDSYYPMEGNMTVFGFGREYPSTQGLISGVPHHLTIGLMDGTQYTQCSKIVTGAYKLLSVSAQSAEQFQLPAPQALYPPDSAQGLPTIVQFSWRSVAGASRYHLQVSLDTAFTSALAHDDSTITDTVATVTTLRVGAVFFWRLRAIANGVNGPWTNRERFSTALPAPEPSEPANGSDITSLTPTLRWSSVAYAVEYQLQVSTDSTFAGTLIVDEWNSGDTVRILPQLTEATTYFWRVAGRTTQVTSSFSGSWRFRTAQLLVAPLLIQPLNGATGLSAIEVFKWTRVAGAITYKLQVASDPTFTGGFVKNDSSIVDTFRTVVGLAHGTTYYWRVQARLASGRTPYTTTWSFATAVNLPAQALLLQPAEGARIRTDSVSFVWHKVEPAVTHYWLEIGFDSDFAFGLVDSTVADTSSRVYIQVRNKPYWWRVRAKNEGGWGPFSAVRTFFAEDPNGVEVENTIPRELSLNQNFPNPFNPSTQIRFALPGQRHVRLEVFSLLGERVATLVDDVLPAGIYTVQMDGHRLSSGVYYCRLTTPEASISRRMLLVK